MSETPTVSQELIPDNSYTPIPSEKSKPTAQELDAIFTRLNDRIGTNKDLAKSDEFDQHNAVYAEKYKDAVTPTNKTAPTIGIVYKAYDELRNGNLAEQISSLARQSIPPDRYEAYFVINNPRFHAALAHIAEKQPDLIDAYSRQQATTLESGQTPNAADGTPVFTSLLSAIEKYYQEKGFQIEPASYEKKQLNKLRDGHVSIDKIISAYKDNQTTIEIVNTITETVNQLETSGDGIEKDDLIAKASAHIMDLTSSTLQEGQRDWLVQAAQMAMSNRVRLVALDSSSIDQAQKEINLGRSMNEGLHFAYNRGARYLSPCDMDQVLHRQGLEEMQSIAGSSTPPDIFIRPFEMIALQYPEEIKAGDANAWESIVGFYNETLGLPAMQEYRSSRTIKSSAKTIFSRDVFAHLEYPELPEDEDFENMYKISQLKYEGKVKFQYLEKSASDLNLSDRRRSTSYDGGHTPRSHNQSVESVLEGLERAKQTALATQLVRNLDFENCLEKTVVLDNYGNNINPELLQQYRQKRTEYFNELQRKKKIARRLFLGANEHDSNTYHGGIVGKLFAAYQTDTTRPIETIIASAEISNHQKAFFEQNPLLVELMVNKAHQENITSASDVCTYLETAFPYILGQPATAEPSYDVPMDPVNIEPADFLHIYKALDWSSRYLHNAESQGTIVVPRNSQLFEQFMV